MKENLKRDVASPVGVMTSSESPEMKSMAAPALDIQAGKEGGEMMLANNPGNRNVAWGIAHMMANEMMRNGGSAKAREIRQKWQSKNPIKKFEALGMWKDMVDYGAPWDHKKMLRERYGEWHADPGNRVEWYFDIWSNIHYGYVGALCGFDAGTLLDGAGAAQALGSSVPDGYWGRVFSHGPLGAFDDPSDQKAILIGCAIAGQNLDADSLLHVMKGSMSELTHRPIRGRA